ncbi:MAG: 50S ribosomal protein L32 [Desulfobacteraceae bacterium]|nr:50S ribosomal protein L32 [Pseudomonadota bacterium]MBU4463648.1 50S ribosomal protein L32 [Pseudomonadota bacterium]MCG2754392.1 50S ribosomal protein L32 [Desulfobacteraceae bacterium]
MAVPKRKKSKSKRDSRRAHTKVPAPNLSVCPQCGEARLPHHVCKSCGSYNRRTVIEAKE